jgi:hypothetical protein
MLRRALLLAVGFAAVSSLATAGDTGYLTVVSTPPAKLLVDDKDTGLTTPVTKKELPAGAHRLTLVSVDGAVKRSLGFTINAGKETKLQINLGN